jgi:hypothetical protein
LSSVNATAASSTGPLRRTRRTSSSSWHGSIYAFDLPPRAHLDVLGHQRSRDEDDIGQRGIQRLQGTQGEQVVNVDPWAPSAARASCEQSLPHAHPSASVRSRSSRMGKRARPQSERATSSSKRMRWSRSCAAGSIVRSAMPAAGSATDARAAASCADPPTGTTGAAAAASGGLGGASTALPLPLTATVRGANMASVVAVPAAGPRCVGESPSLVTSDYLLISAPHTATHHLRHHAVLQDKAACQSKCCTQGERDHHRLRFTLHAVLPLRLNVCV